ncbi:ImmA/IrrE family metallo-endopeptidase [Alkalicoccus luteus]|uniref:ImmA/IrrE family metallo-endopeptidase n=1 Tax=Alkalicoccus luteus TaxID=1237094 RepID=A0A969PR73_9BACI|nr:ImmA/IrrE family metallo-endopeptidase [Alkalicoccus luteus]
MYLTDLETFVKRIYTEVDDISIRGLSIHFNINITYHAGDPAIVHYDGYTTLLLDLRSNDAQQWENFAHELGHVLRHGSNQRVMADQFRQLQEAQANNFMYHLCIPTHLLSDFELAETKDATIRKLAKEFGVTVPFARKRWDMWEQRCFEHELMERDYETFKAQSNVESLDEPVITPITQIQVDRNPEGYHLIDVYGQEFYITHAEYQAYQYILSLEIKPDLTVNPYELEIEFRSFLNTFTKDDYEIIYSSFGEY